MRIALKTKKKLGFVNGTLPMPEPTDPDYEIWDQSNTNVIGWILNSLIDPIAEAVMDNETAQDIWKDLQERYGEADSVRLAHVKGLIASCKQEKSTVTEYYNRLGVFWTEYMSFKSIPPCECGDTPHTMNCVTYVAVKESQEQDHTIDFIMGLSDAFEMTKNQLLMMDPAPSLKVAYKYALKLERQMTKQPPKEAAGVDSVALAAANQGRNRDQRAEYPRGGRQNTYQGNYPNNQQRGTNETGGGGQQNLLCNYYKRTNHVMADCWRLKRKRGELAGPNFAGAATSGGNHDQGINSFSAANEQDNRSQNTTTFQLTAEDCSRLMMLLHQQNTGSQATNQPNIQPQAHSVSRHINQMPDNAGPSYTEEDWFCKRA
ncbi:unnamed protein product [Linum trigynum]|uniref:Retrotransposon gag domain-containing protein n=1 Tax=Linum trigynum TaxID=586398 RepID=A0AAV2ESK5_9ROSI